MRVRPIVGTIRLRGVDPSLVRGLLLAAVFLGGGLLGRWYAGGWNGEQAGELAGYLTDYCSVYQAEGVTPSLSGCVLLYFGSAALTFLLGFASLGVILIPALAGALGFSAMYTVSCFVLTFGRSGALLALGLLGVRLLFTLPCFFLMASQAWPLSTDLAMLALGRGKRSAPVLYGSRYFLLFFFCVLCLAAGVCCERFLTPLLFQLALKGLA